MSWEHTRQQVVFYKDILFFYFKHVRNYQAVTHPVNTEITPKIIHYCWFGRGKMGDREQACLATWRNILPDYKIIKWDEDNFPYQDYPFAAQALRDRKWAFVSDVARLYALYHYGGVYMDTDVEVIKDFTPLIDHGFFTGRESEFYAVTGLMGAKKGNDFVKLLLDWYADRQYGKEYYRITNARIITRIMRLVSNLPKGTQAYHFGDSYIYPQDYFCPARMEKGWSITENTCCIHHISGAGWNLTSEN